MTTAKSCFQTDFPMQWIKENMRREEAFLAGHLTVNSCFIGFLESYLLDPKWSQMCWESVYNFTGYESKCAAHRL